MAQGVRSLVWFRSDLRVADNTALFEACRRAGGASGKGVVAVFLISPGEWAAHDFAPIKVDFILRSLAVLSADLAKLNIPLSWLHSRRSTPATSCTSIRSTRSTRRSATPR